MKGSLTQWVVLYLVFGVFWAMFVNMAGSMHGGHSVFSDISASEPVRTKILTVGQTLGGQILLWPLQVYEHARQMILG
jgi:hypothetical protein